MIEISPVGHGTSHTMRKTRDLQQSQKRPCGRNFEGPSMWYSAKFGIDTSVSDLSVTGSIFVAI